MRHSHHYRNRILKRALLMTVGSLAFSTAVAAQVAAPANDETAALDPAYAETTDAEATIVVTGSRITRNGFDMPTPVTVVGTADMQARGTTNVANLLNELPSFRASFSPTATNTQSGAVSGNYLDLRGLGVTKTLVLLDGRRIAPTYTSSAIISSATNINVVPSIAVERVEVVTGGASAAYGSDAVAGVANLIFNRRFTGIKAEIQTGISQEGDAQEYSAAAMAGGKFADDRGHFMMAFEYNKTKGVLDQGDRDWGRRGYQRYVNPADTGPNDGQPAQITRANVRLANATYGGVIVTPGPLANIEFLPGGATRLLPFGTERSSSFMVGGGGADISQGTTIAYPQERKTFVATFDYDLTDDVSFFFDALYGDAKSKVAISPYFRLGDITISSDNAFLPENVRQIALANNIQSFRVGRISRDFGETTALGSNQTYRLVGGVKGDFSSKWRWEASYTFSSLDYSTIGQDNVITANFAAAVDAVRNPANGNIVCRSTLNAASLPAGLQDLASRCVPLNIFGVGSGDAAAIDFVQGDSLYVSTNTQSVFSAFVEGELFSLWSKPISVAAGFDYRREAIDIRPDEISRNSGYYQFNNGPMDEAFNVKEGFVEVVAPIVQDRPFLKSLEVSGAFRQIDYSTSGQASTWKAGINWEPTKGIRLRGTLSRDIRAPNFRELFAASQVTFASLRDPCAASNQAANSSAAANCRAIGIPSNFVQTVGTVQINTTGNPDLTVEKADTKTLGVVLSPAFLPGFRASVDWYDIQIKDNIGALPDQQILDLCYSLSGPTPGPTCSAITRDTAGNMTSVRRLVFNIATRRTSGVDIDVVHNFRAPALFGDEPGKIAARAIATYVYRLNNSPDGINLIENAGDQVGRPKWMGQASISYDNGPLGLFFLSRYIGSSKIENRFVQGVDIDDNHVSAQWYFDASARLAIDEERKFEFFGGVRNLTNNDPPITPTTLFLSFGANGALYDTIGRSFYVGARARF